MGVTLAKKTLKPAKAKTLHETKPTVEVREPRPRRDWLPANPVGFLNLIKHLHAEKRTNDLARILNRLDASFTAYRKRGLSRAKAYGVLGDAMVDLLMADVEPAKAEELRQKAFAVFNRKGR